MACDCTIEFFRKKKANVDVQIRKVLEEVDRFKAMDLKVPQNFEIIEPPYSPDATEEEDNSETVNCNLSFSLIIFASEDSQ